MFTKYDINSGKILGFIADNLDNAMLNIDDNTSLIPGNYSENLNYVNLDTGEVMYKSSFNIIIVGNIITGIPVGTLIYLPQYEIEEVVTSGQLEVSGQYQEEIEVILDHPHFLKETRKIII